MIFITLIERLGRLSRETDLEYDPRWDLLAGGSLPPGEVEALRSACGGTQLGDTLLTGFTPLDAAARERIAMNVLASRGLSRAPRVVPLRRVGVAACATAAFLGLAASVAFFVGLPSDPPTRVAEHPTPGSPLPRYHLEVKGGVGRAIRAQEPPGAGAAEAGVTTLGERASMEVLLRPEKAAGPEATPVGCVWREGSTRPWPVVWERSEQGSFRVAGTRESLFPGEPPGEVTLLFAVGEPSRSPSCESLAAATSQSVLSQRVILK